MVFLLSLGILASGQLPIRTTASADMATTRVLRPEKQLLKPVIVKPRRQLYREPEASAQQQQQQQDPATVVRTLPDLGEGEAPIRSTTVKPAPAPPATAFREPEGNWAANHNENKPSYLGYGLALDPVQNDLLALGVKAEGEETYNIHEIPAIDGE